MIANAVRRRGVAIPLVALLPACTANFAARGDARVATDTGVAGEATAEADVEADVAVEAVTLGKDTRDGRPELTYTDEFQIGQGARSRDNFYVR